MGDVPGHLVMLLMNVAVENRDVAMGKKQVDRLRAVASGPVPLRIKIEEWTMGEHDDVRVRGLPGEVRREPLQLLVSDQRAWVGHVVDGDEVHAFVIEGVMGGSEEFLKSLPVIKRGIVLARHEMNVLHLELA